MKRFYWLLIGSVVLCLILLVGCGVPQSEYETLQTEHAALVQEKASLTAELEAAQSDLTNAQAENDTLKTNYAELNANYETVSEELAEIKEVYPPRDFSSLQKLQDWLLNNDVSERPVTTTAERWYSKALEIQEDALKDGYIVSVDYEGPDDEDNYMVFCVTIINGDIWYWDPETDEPYQDYSWGKVK